MCIKQLTLVLLIMQLFFRGFLVAIDPAVVKETVSQVVNESASAASVDAAKAAADGAAELSPEMKVLLGQCQELLGVVSTVSMIKSLSSDALAAGCAINSYVKGDDKEAVDDLKVSAAYDYLLARKIFKSCLVKNARGAKNTAGRPAVCEEAARMFALLGGDPEIEQMTEVFKRICAQHVH